MTKSSFSIALLGLLGVAALSGCGSAPTSVPIIAAATEPVNLKGTKTLVVGGGCFWCVETVLEELIGVEKVESGYAGGAKAGVTYEEVSSGTTGHAEVVKIWYNPNKISRVDLLHVFMTAHDPTTLNAQGQDFGTQYRSAIFYESAADKAIAEGVIADMTREKVWKNPIVTTLEPLKNYTTAEEYHQNYFEKYAKADDATRAGMNSGYCKLIIEPKVKEFRKKYAAKLRKPS